MTIPGRRLLNFAGFLACAGLMGYALYAEHVLMLMPCPLCVFQRMAVISLGIIFLVAALHNPSGRGRWVYSVLLLLAAGAVSVLPGVTSGCKICQRTRCLRVGRDSSTSSMHFRSRML